MLLGKMHRMDDTCDLNFSFVTCYFKESVQQYYVVDTRCYIIVSYLCLNSHSRCVH